MPKCQTCTKVKPHTDFAPAAEKGNWQRCRLCEANYRRGLRRRPGSYRDAYLASKKKYGEDYRERLLLEAARRRAKDLGCEFALTEFDIHIPDKCPVLGTSFKEEGGKWAKGPAAPSIDRMDSALGYTMTNINVISQRANTIKNNATAEELEAVARWMRNTLAQRMAF